MKQKSRDGRGGYPLDARRLAQGRWPNIGEALTNLRGEAMHGGIVKIRRQAQRLVASEGTNISLLALHVTSINCIDLELFRDSGRKSAQCGPDTGKGSEVDVGIAQEVGCGARD